MPFMDEEQEVLIEGAVISVGGPALLLVCGLIWGAPWQTIPVVVAFTAVLGGVITTKSPADVQRDAERRASSHGALITWAGRNMGRCGTDLAAFTTDGEVWELSSSPLFRGELLAMGHRDGVEVSSSSAAGAYRRAPTAVRSRGRGSRWSRPRSHTRYRLGNAAS